MCYGDPGMKHVLRETEARLATVMQDWKEDGQATPARPGLVAWLRAALAARVRKAAPHV